MEPIQDYFSISESKNPQRTSWGNEWSTAISPWETTTPTEMPIWQYTTAALSQGEPSMPYYPTGSPISPYPHPGSSIPSANPSPNVAVFPHHAHHDGRFTPITPIYENSNHHSNLPTPQVQQLQIKQVTDYSESSEREDVIVEDEESESFTWESNRSPNTPPSTLSLNRPSHGRSQSANEATLKNAKRAHTVVERNYRERLNDKIADLALYLFETSSDSRTKPSKSLVMTRAKERLKQLESRNKSLESEVVKLRQHIAILDHIVASKNGEPAPTPA